MRIAADFGQGANSSLSRTRTFVSPCVIFTPKALNNIAQGQRSGAAAKRHPGFVANRGFPTRNGLQKFLWNPFGIRSVTHIPDPGLRCARPGL